MITKTEEKYIEIMRKKSGQERLRIAAELRKLVIKLAETEIKSRNSKISPERVQQFLQERIYGFSLPSKNSCK